MATDKIKQLSELLNTKYSEFQKEYDPKDIGIYQIASIKKALSITSKEDAVIVIDALEEFLVNEISEACPDDNTFQEASTTLTLFGEAEITNMFNYQSGMAPPIADAHETAELTQIVANAKQGSAHPLIQFYANAISEMSDDQYNSIGAHAVLLIKIEKFRREQDTQKMPPKGKPFSK